MHFLQPRLAALPAQIVQIFPGRADHVGRALDQVAPSVAVIIHRVAIIFRRHHLGLPELARPGADHLLRPQVAALDHAQRVEQMAAEHVAAPAVIGQRRQRLERLVLALAGAEIALQPPERGDDRGRHAVILLLAGEDRLEFLDLGHARGQPGAGQHLVGEFEEVLREEALPPVDADDALVEHQIGRCRVEGGGRDALGQGLLLEVGEPAVEVAGIAAIGVLGEGGGRRQGQKSRDQSRHEAGAGRPSHAGPAGNHVSHWIVRCLWMILSLRKGPPASPPC